MIYDMQYESNMYLYVAWFIRHCGLGLICFGLGLTENFWPRPHTFWPRPHPSLASLTSLPCRQMWFKRATFSVDNETGTVFRMVLHFLVHKAAAWLSGNALVLINVVALHRARLVLGWVTIRGYTILVLNQSHPGLLSLAIPPWVGTMITGGGLGHH